jgi:hypothetical protein
MGRIMGRLAMNMGALAILIFSCEPVKPDNHPIDPVSRISQSLHMAPKSNQQREQVAGEAQAPSHRIKPSSFIDKVMLDQIPKEDQ